MNSRAPSPFTVEVFLNEEDLRRSLINDARRGLTATPKDLPPKWFYDAHGSELFDRITHLEEYYPTETERGILRNSARRIVETAAADTLVELGSGSSDKTTVLLDAMCSTEGLRRYVPFDVSHSALTQASSTMAARYPDIEIHAIVGDFDKHLDRIPEAGRRLVAFLGGTIGNYPPAARRVFFAGLAKVLRPADSLLLGADLVKDRSRLIRAYDDDAGVTAAFNKNVLAVMNRELGANFQLDRFEHVARWDEDQEWIEMRLRSLSDQVVDVDALGLQVPFARGEEMRTEISAKFRRRGLTRELDAAGFDVIGWFSDPAGDFALALANKR